MTLFPDPLAPVRFAPWPTGQGKKGQFIIDIEAASALTRWLACSAFALTVSTTSQAQLEPPEELFPPSGDLRYELLFMGNSHSSANGLPSLVSLMIRQGQGLAAVGWQLAPGYRFLSERLNDGESLPLMIGNDWTHVILQAQKYSTSGLYYYPTDAAEEFIRRAKVQGAQPILFPEWPRRGNTEEGPRVHRLHLEIASREAACVAPIGLAWEASLASRPALVLHDPDGNHSNLNGAVLTAYVLYEVITGQAAEALPDIPALGVAADIQRHLKTIASSVVASDAAGCQDVTAVAEWAIPTHRPAGLAIMILVMAGLASLSLRRGRKL